MTALPSTRNSSSRLKAELAALATEVFPGRVDKSLLSRLLELYRLAEDLSEASKTVLDPISGARVREVLVGGKWVYSPRQRRWKRQYFRRTRGVGRPDNGYARAFLVLLGHEYMRTTGLVPTRGATDGRLSRFELFARQMIRPFDVRGSRKLVKEYIRNRKAAQRPLP